MVTSARCRGTALCGNILGVGVRVRALAGVLGPVAFTAAWLAGSLRQTGHGALSVQLSGLAAPDARDPWIMITGFLVLGGCMVVFGQELAGELTGLAPRLIQAAGVLTIAAGLLRRDHMELTSGPVSWHNQAHNIVSLVLYADLVLAQLLLARSFGRTPSWRAWRPYLLASATATAVALAVFVPDTAAAGAGILQRIAVTIPLLAVTAVAARLAALDASERPRPTAAALRTADDTPPTGPVPELIPAKHYIT